MERKQESELPVSILSPDPEDFGDDDVKTKLEKRS
jgi:hypothetical protein